MSEGPYTKIGAIVGIMALFIGYLSLAYTVKWPPFHAGATQSPQGNSASESPSPKLPSQLDGVWIAQLASIPISADKSQLQRVLGEIRNDIPEAQYLDSSNYASLKPGYWVVYYRGAFSNGNQALSFCASHGRTARDQCIGRFLSHNAADSGYMCFPPAGSQTTGCYHDPSGTATKIVQVWPFRGLWQVHDGSLCVGDSLHLPASNGAPPCQGSGNTGWMRWWEGCNILPTTPPSTVPVCNGWAELTFTGGPADTITGTVTKVLYTTVRGAVITGYNPGPGYLQPGDTFRLARVATGLLKTTYLHTHLSPEDITYGNPYWCGRGISTANQFKCGA